MSSMSNSYQRNYPKRRYDPKDEAFEKILAYVPKSLVAILKSRSEVLCLPVSRLICFALDNELDTDSPFNYPTFLPEAPYVEYAYADEASKMMAYLRKFPAGTGRDTLILCRRDYGVMKRDDAMHAYRELLEKGMIEEFRPRHTKFHHKDTYLYSRIVELDPRKLKEQRNKRVESESTKFQRNVHDTDDPHDT